MISKGKGLSRNLQTLPPFFVTMLPIAWKGSRDLGVCCLKKIDNSHSPLKSHLLPIKWKSHYWPSQGVSGSCGGSDHLPALSLQPCYLQRGKSSPYFSTTSVLFTLNHASPQTAVGIKYS